MTHHYFYLPIYKTPKEQFFKKIDEKITRRKEEIAQETGGTLSHERALLIADNIEKEYGRSWFENQARGWIKVGKGKGGFTFIPAKSNPLNPHKPKRYFEQIPPDKCFGGYHVITFEKCNSNEEFLNKFEEVFSAIVSQEPFKGCYVDDTQLKKLSKFIDWKALRDDKEV
jgi:hypothetical protein